MKLSALRGVVLNQAGAGIYINPPTLSEKILEKWFTSSLFELILRGWRVKILLTNCYLYLKGKIFFLFKLNYCSLFTLFICHYFYFFFKDNYEDIYIPLIRFLGAGCPPPQSRWRDTGSRPTHSESSRSVAVSGRMFMI